MKPNISDSNFVKAKSPCWELKESKLDYGGKFQMSVLWPIYQKRQVVDNSGDLLTWLMKLDNSIYWLESDWSSNREDWLPFAYFAKSVNFKIWCW